MDFAKNSELYLQAGKAWEEAKAAYSPYVGKDDIPGEAQAAWDKAIADHEAKLKAARSMEQAAKVDAFYNDVETKNRLPVTVAGGETKEAVIDRETKQYNEVMANMQNGGGYRFDDLPLSLKKFNIEQRIEWFRTNGSRVPENLLKLDRILQSQALETKTEYQEGTAAQGGSLVPTLYLKQLAQLRYVGSFVRQAGARIIPLNTWQTVVPRVTAASAAAVLVSEEGSETATKAGTSSVTFKAFRYYKLSLATEELIADSNFPLMEAIIIPDFAQAFAAAENLAFTTGTGTNEPQGLNAITFGKTAATTNTFTSAEIIDTFHNLGIQYRQNAAWMAHDLVYAFIRKIVDQSGGATAGNWLWQPGLSLGMPDRMLGRPVYVNNSMDSAFTTGKKLLIVGDFDFGYWIGERQGVEQRVLRELYAATYQVGFQASERIDGHIMAPTGSAGALTGLVLA